MPDIEIFTQPHCPYCDAARALLRRKGAPFRDVHAPYGTPARDDAIRRSGGCTTVPQIFIGGRHVGGFDDLSALDRAGRLDPLLAA